MSTGPHIRRQGEFELRVLKDGRLVMVAPDETLLEIAKAFDDIGAVSEAHREGQHAEAGRAERRPASDHR
jgi:hypothetical protein